MIRWLLVIMFIVKVFFLFSQNQANRFCIDSLAIPPANQSSGVYAVQVVYPYFLYTSVRDTLNSEDIWVAKVDKNGNVSSKKSLIKGITTEYTEGSPCYASRTKTLYYSRYRPGYKYVHIAVAKYNIRKNKATFIGFLSDSINTNNSWNSMPFLSKNEDTLYFVSKREGNIGGTDIWYSTWNKKLRQWNSAKNLAVYNTSFNESAPFIDYQTQTFYFSSDSTGTYDIYAAPINHKQKAMLVSELSSKEYDEKYFRWYKSFGYISRKKSVKGPDIYHKQYQTYKVLKK